MAVPVCCYYYYFGQGTAVSSRPQFLSTAGAAALGGKQHPHGDRPLCHRQRFSLFPLRAPHSQPHVLDDLERVSLFNFCSCGSGDWQLLLPLLLSLAAAAGQRETPPV